MYITRDIRYVGVLDRALDLFEGQYPVPDGMAYNSYVIEDEQCAVVDSVEVRFAEEWIGNIRTALQGRSPDYLIVQHMEPDHSGSLLRFLEAFPHTQLVATQRAFVMMGNFFGTTFHGRAVDEGDTLSLGRHTLTFHTAAMVHWPEVMVTYDSADKVLFSADAFGRFGEPNDAEDWTDEAARYYFGIVGKYGGPVQAVLKKLAGVPIDIICSLHGPVLREKAAEALALYHIWSSYVPEKEGIVIAYTSIYGNTGRAAEQLAARLRELGQTVVSYDLARCDQYAAVADAFRYDRLVLATTTYNGGIFPAMHHFIGHLTERGFTNRTVGFIENGSWAPAAMRVMRGLLEKGKPLVYAEHGVTILSALNETSEAQLEALALELAGTVSEAVPVEAPAVDEPKKKFVCRICGYIHEAERLPDNFTCPLCGRPASDFEEVK